MASALKWSAVDRTLQQGVQFIIGIVLARLLCPADYGLIGMIMIFAQLAYVMVESGLGAALLRTKDITETHYNTMFYTNMALSVVMYVALFFLASSSMSLVPVRIVSIVSTGCSIKYFDVVGLAVWNI